MIVPRETIESAHLDSIRNKESIKNSILCGCYFCLEIFPADYVEEFLEESRGDSTALCPYCEIDSVIGDSKVSLSKELLEELHKSWFGVIKL